MFGRSSVGVAVGPGAVVGVGVPATTTGQMPAAESFTRNLVPSPVPANVMQYRFDPPSRLRTTLMVRAPFGTGTGSPFATTLRSPDFALAIFTIDGPLGAEAFLYLNSVPEAFALQLLAGRLSVAALVPSSNVIELLEPPTGLEPVMLMPASFDTRTRCGVLFKSSFFPVMP